MHEVVTKHVRADEHLKHLVAALDTGVILLDSDRQIVWMDEATRARLNGGMADLASTLHDLEAAGGVSCDLSTRKVLINGEEATVCLIHERPQDKQEFDLIAALEATLADTASWFTHTVVEKLKALRQARRQEPQASDLEVLSDREREVLGLICEGRSDTEMSAILGLSQNTVRNHIASLYRKIGVNRRTGAVIWARERGITAQDALSSWRRTRSRANHPRANHPQE